MPKRHIKVLVPVCILLFWIFPSLFIFKELSHKPYSNEILIACIHMIFVGFFVLYSLLQVFLKGFLTFQVKYTFEPIALLFSKAIVLLSIQLLPDKRTQRKHEWLDTLDETPNFQEKISLALGFLQATFILQRKRLPKYLIPQSRNHKTILIRTFFVSSILFFFQMAIALSGYLFTYEPITISLSLILTLKIFSTIYKSPRLFTQNHFFPSKVNHWSLIQIGLLMYIFVFKTHNAESQLILFSLLALHIIFFQTTVKEITILLKEWRSRNKDCFSEN